LQLIDGFAFYSSDKPDPFALLSFILITVASNHWLSVITTMSQLTPHASLAFAYLSSQTGMHEVSLGKVIVFVCIPTLLLDNPAMFHLLIYQHNISGFPIE